MKRFCIATLFAILTVSATLPAAAIAPPINALATPAAQQRSVDLYVTAQEGSAFITDLNRSDFEVLEDNKPQEVRSFNQPGETAASVLFLIDRGKDSRVEDLGRAEAVLNACVQALDPKSEIELAAYSMEPRVIQGFTLDRRSLSSRIKQIPSYTEKSSTGDAIDYAVRSLLSEAHNRRRVLVVLSSSFHQFGPATLDHVIEQFVQLHFVNMGSESLGPSLPFSNSSARKLNASAGKTGGRFWQANSAEDGRTTGQDLARFLDAQYSLQYHPGNQSRKGKSRTVTVKTKGRDLDLTFLRQYFEPRY